MMDDPMKMQTADAGKVRCRDCIYRDRETMKIGDKRILIGVTRDTCMIYDGQKGNWKPTSVILRNRNCEFYEKDEEA